MQLVMKPNLYDVLVCPNLYGDILSDLCAGLTGGLGVAPGANIGEEIAVFEPVHGSAPKYAGQNRANPLATLLSAKNMLIHLDYSEEADRMQAGIEAALKSPQTRTKDLGGSAGTREFTQAIVSNRRIGVWIVTSGHRRLVLSGSHKTCRGAGWRRHGAALAGFGHG